MKNLKFCAEHNSKWHLLKDTGLFEEEIILIHQLHLPFFSCMCILCACTRWQRRLQLGGRHFQLFHQWGAATGTDSVIRRPTEGVNSIVISYISIAEVVATLTILDLQNCLTDNESLTAEWHTSPCISSIQGGGLGGPGPPWPPDLEAPVHNLRAIQWILGPLFYIFSNKCSASLHSAWIFYFFHILPVSLCSLFHIYLIFLCEYFYIIWTQPIIFLVCND